jgi:Carboxypeptidase regulatory-like domain
MPAWMLLLALLAGDPAPRSAVEATIRGTAQPLEVRLLVRDASEQWQEVAYEMLPAATRDVRFDGLASGVYQLLVKGPQTTERIATKVVLGTNDTRRITISIEPFAFTGRITTGGVALGPAELLLRHDELHWRAGIAVDRLGAFRVPMWQRGAFTYTLRAPALTTQYSDAVELAGDAPAFALDIPVARITGVVRDAKSGAAIANALVLLQTNSGDDEHHVRLRTGADGSFDFTGVKDGQHVVRVVASNYVEPDPVAFELDAKRRLRELDIRVDPGRAIAVLVIDADGDPVADATLFALAGARLASRAITDEDGRATVAALAGEEATLVVVARPSGLAAVRVPRDAQPGRLRIELARPSSSLHIRARTTAGAAMPQFSLLLRYNGTILPAAINEELAALQRLHLATDQNSDVVLRNIPAGSYELWPYRTADEAEAILSAGDAVEAPIRVEVRPGENTIGVRFAAR